MRSMKLFIMFSCRVTFYVHFLPFVIINSRLIFSAGYYSAPIFFLQFKEFELYWGAVFFLRLEEEYWRSPFFFNQFYWSDF